MKTASAKAKGRSLAKKIAEWLVVLGNLGPRDVHATNSGVTGKDITFSEAGRAKWPLAIECKKHASFAVYKHYDQACENADEDEIPVLVIEANRREPLVVVDAEVFFEAIRGHRIWLGTQ